MRILIAEDDLISRMMLEGMLGQWGHEVTTVEDGAAAWQVLQAPDAPMLALVDWMMPEMDGIEVCRKVKAVGSVNTPYLILITARQDSASIVKGLDAGADDYIRKPYDADELRARVNVGMRMLALQQALVDRVHKLEDALAHVKTLQGILPICSYCKKVRNDENYWQQVESYIGAHSDMQFSHGICPECRPIVMEAARRELQQLNAPQ